MMPRSACNEQRHTPTQGSPLAKPRFWECAQKEGGPAGPRLGHLAALRGLLGIKRQDLFYFQAWLSAFKAAHSHDFVLSRSHAKQKEPYFLSRSLSAALI